MIATAGDALVRMFLAIAGAEAARRAKRRAAAIAGGAVFFLLAAACAVVALGIGIAALWINLVPYLGPGGAPLVTFAALLLLAVIAFFVGRAIMRGGRSEPAKTPSNLSGVDLKQLFQEHEAALLIAAFIGGLLTGRERARR